MEEGEGAQRRCVKRDVALTTFSPKSRDAPAGLRHGEESGVEWEELRSA